MLDLPGRYRLLATMSSIVPDFIIICVFFEVISFFFKFNYYIAKTFDIIKGLVLFRPEQRLHHKLNFRQYFLMGLFYLIFAKTYSPFFRLLINNIRLIILVANFTKFYILPSSIYKRT